jgi:type 1 glutamine amidotransferase
MVGRMFVIHPTIQTAKLKVLDAKFPGLKDLDSKLWTDEWYEFSPEKTTGLNYILSVDESTYNPKVNWGAKKGEGMGQMHPISWYHDYDGGRAFYTGLGHMPSIYSEKVFLDHLYAGIVYAATGKK